MHIKFCFKFVIKIPKHTAKALQKSEHRLLSTVLRFKLLFQISDLNVLNRIEAKIYRRQPKSRGLRSVLRIGGDSGNASGGA